MLPKLNTFEEVCDAIRSFPYQWELTSRGRIRMTKESSGLDSSIDCTCPLYAVAIHQGGERFVDALVGPDVFDAVITAADADFYDAVFHRRRTMLLEACGLK